MVASFKNLNNYTFDLIISYQDIYPRETDVCVKEPHRIILCRLFCMAKRKTLEIKTGNGQVNLVYLYNKLLSTILSRNK